MRNKIMLYDDDVGSVELVEHMGTDLTIVNSARVSFGKHREELDERDRNLIKYLIKHRHTSTFEHNVATFRITAPLFIRSQHMRHRTWSYNEISRRYTEVNIQFYEPPMFRTQHESNRQASNLQHLINPIIDANNISGGNEASYLVQVHHKNALSLYHKLIDNGVCREQARGVLPQNLYTEYYATANLNNILKFISLRTHAGAQWEIQQLAFGIQRLIREIWPEAVEAYQTIAQK